MVKIYKAEIELENYRTQAVTSFNFFRPVQKDYSEITMKIDTGSSITLLRNVNFQGLKVQSRVVGNEAEAIATNGTRFAVQQVQLIGTLEIGKIHIENPVVYVTKPKTQAEIKIDNARSNLLGFDLISCCSSFHINLPANFKLMTCQLHFRSDRLAKYCSNVSAPEQWVDEIEM